MAMTFFFYSLSWWVWSVHVISCVLHF